MDRIGFLIHTLNLYLPQVSITPATQGRTPPSLWLWYHVTGNACCWAVGHDFPGACTPVWLVSWSRVRVQDFYASSFQNKITLSNIIISLSYISHFNQSVFTSIANMLATINQYVISFMQKTAMYRNCLANMIAIVLFIIMWDVR